MTSWRGLGASSAVAVLATIGLAGAALADGGPRRGKVAQACCIDWGGLYFGIHAGYLRSDADWTFTAAPGLIHSSSQDGATAGIQVGLQHQFGNAVIGIEAGLTSSLNPWNFNDVIAFNPAFIGEHRVDNILTLGARLGFAFNRVMPYITGGYAGAAVSDRAVFSAGAAVGQTFWRSRDRHDGWYVGAGVDWAVHCCDSAWTIGLEYRHYEFDDTTRVPAGNAGVLVTGDRHILDLDRTDTLAVRLNYKIGRPPQPLK